MIPVRDHDHDDKIVFQDCDYHDIVVVVVAIAVRLIGLWGSRSEDGIHDYFMVNDYVR